LIVCTTAQLDVLDARLAAGSERSDVMELEETTLVAAPSIPADERAPAVVALPNHPSHGGGNVAGAAPPVGDARRDAT
jgi:hypothetical protein